MINKAFYSTLLCSGLLISSVAIAAPKGVKLAPNYISFEDKSVCGFDGKKWQGGRINKTGKFFKFSKEIKDLKKKARKTKNTKLLKKAAKLNKRNKKAKKVCKKLALPSSELNSLQQLPKLDGIVNSAIASKVRVRQNTNKGKKSKSTTKSPPSLETLSEGNLTKYFWDDAVISELASGESSEKSCGEFYVGAEEGTPGGLGACLMAQSTGVSFQPIIEAGSNLCYMKNAFTEAVLNAGGITISSGELPEGDIGKLFSPGEKDRVVKIVIPGEFDEEEDEEELNVKAKDSSEDIIFVRIPSKSSLLTSGTKFSSQLWYCEASTGKPDGAENITISNDNLFTSVANYDEGEEGAFQATVTGSVKLDETGNYEFDEASVRKAFVAEIGKEFSFKSQIELGESSVKVKMYDKYMGETGIRYITSTVGGDELGNISFLEGAYKDRVISDSKTIQELVGGVKYNPASGKYIVEKSSNLFNEANSVNLDSDNFYKKAPSVKFDATGYDCNITPDVEISLNFDNQVLVESVEECEEYEEEEFNFCFEDDTISNAEENYYELCLGASFPNENSNEGLKDSPELDEDAPDFPDLK